MAKKYYYTDDYDFYTSNTVGVVFNKDHKQWRCTYTNRGVIFTATYSHHQRDLAIQWRKDLEEKYGVPDIKRKRRGYK